MRAMFDKEIHVIQHSRTKYLENQRQLPELDSPENRKAVRQWSLRRSQPLVKEPAVDFAIGKVKNLPLINADDADEKNSRFFFDQRCQRSSAVRFFFSIAAHVRMLKTKWNQFRISSIPTG